MAQPAVSKKAYFLVYLSLLGLTLATTLLGFIDMGVLNMVVAVGIAAIKAALIASIFMHALYESKLVHVAIGAAVIWFLIMISFTAVDYVSRGWA